MSHRATSLPKDSSPAPHSPRRTRSPSTADAKSEMGSCSSEEFNPRNLVTNTSSGIGESEQQSDFAIASAINRSRCSHSVSTSFPAERLAQERIRSSEPPPPNATIATSSGSCSVAQDSSSEEFDPRNQADYARIQRIRKGKAIMREIEEDEILEEVIDHVEENFPDENAWRLWDQLLRRAKNYRSTKEKLEEILQNKEQEVKKKNDNEDKVLDSEKELERLSTRKNEIQEDAENTAKNKEKEADTVSTQKKKSGGEKITEKIRAAGHKTWEKVKKMLS